MKIKLITLIGLVLIALSCESRGYLSPIRKNIQPAQLVKMLKQDSLMYSFKGYAVTPRGERTGVYLVSRKQDRYIHHWVKYSPSEISYSTYYDSYINSDSILIKLTSEDSLKILEKAHELIGLCKRLDLRWAGWESKYFECYFNDSTRMMYVENKTELDSDFYRLNDNIEWVDSNFVIYN